MSLEQLRLFDYSPLPPSPPTLPPPPPHPIPDVVTCWKCRAQGGRRCFDWVVVDGQRVKRERDSPHHGRLKELRTKAKIERQVRRKRDPDSKHYGPVEMAWRRYDNAMRSRQRWFEQHPGVQENDSD